ncbi:hypothetical protein [Methanosarcina horonobensis]|nr:hypothetical protein [Methanosarcina horonobensis]
MKPVLDEEEIWVLECIKEANLDRGFHIRDIIKKSKNRVWIIQVNSL